MEALKESMEIYLSESREICQKHIQSLMVTLILMLVTLLGINMDGSDYVWRYLIHPFRRANQMHRLNQARNGRNGDILSENNNNNSEDNAMQNEQPATLIADDNNDIHSSSNSSNNNLEKEGSAATEPTKVTESDTSKLSEANQNCNPAHPTSAKIIQSAGPSRIITKVSQHTKDIIRENTETLRVIREDSSGKVKSEIVTTKRVRTEESSTETSVETTFIDDPWFDKLLYAASVTQGKRTHQEDRHKIFREFDKLISDALPDSINFSDIQNKRKLGRVMAITVIDGHGGSAAADFVEANLAKNIAKSMAHKLSGKESPFASEIASFDQSNGGTQRIIGLIQPMEQCHPSKCSQGSLIDDCILEGFKATEEHWKHSVLESEDESGAACAFAVIHDQCLHVANLGDVEAYICRSLDQKDQCGGKTFESIKLSMLHSPKEEKERVDEETGEERLDVERLKQGLSVSRAFGNYERRTPKNKNDDVFRKTIGLSAIPTIVSHSITNKDEFLLMACDGVWLFDECPKYDDCIRRVRFHLRLQYSQTSCQKACEELMRGGDCFDNSTAIVVSFSQFKDDTAKVDPSMSRLRCRRKLPNRG